MRFLVIAVSLFAFTVSPLNARYKMGGGKPVPVKKGEAKPAPASSSPPFKPFPPRGSQKIDETPVLKSLSARYAVEPEQLKYYRDLHFGYEEIVPALIVSREAKVEAGRIFNDRMTGKSWKKISQDYNVELKPLNKEVLDVLTPIRKALPKKVITERPQTRQ